MASLGGEAPATQWTGVNVTTYVPAAVESLMYYYTSYQLDGFEIAFGASLHDAGTCAACGGASAYATWVSAWSQIITQLKSQTVSGFNNQVRQSAGLQLHIASL